MIRPFQLGDLFLVQRLGRQTARLNTIQSLIEPQSSFWTSLFSILPWNHAKVATYVLRQEGHSLLGDGFLHTRRRPDSPEVDVVYLAPALMSEFGHPVIWEKLLAHYNRLAAQQKIERIYVDVADQPLPITTFHRAGYRVYARQTVWRLAAHRIDDYAGIISARIRPQRNIDRWGLTRLYTQTVPKPVQLAEGTGTPGRAAGHDRQIPPPIVHWRQAGTCTPYVLEAEGEVAGSLQIAEGRRGIWFQLWADTNNPNPYVVHELLRYGLSVLYRWGTRKPVYIGVYDYQVGMNAVLSDYGFAPVTDRARMVRPLAHWVREVQSVTSQALESVPQIPIIPFDLPQADPTRGGAARGRRMLPRTLWSRNLWSRNVWSRQEPDDFATDSRLLRSRSRGYAGKRQLCTHLCADLYSELYREQHSELAAIE